MLEAMDRYLTAISGSDHGAMAAMQAPDGMTYQWRPAGDGDMRITAHPNSFWSDPSRDDGRVNRERYWSPHVMIRGGPWPYGGKRVVLLLLLFVMVWFEVA